MDETDPYELLQVHPKAAPAVIKKAYRALMLELGAHPDAGGDAAFSSQLSNAYALLMDPERRAAYDRRRGEAAAAPSGEAPSVVVPCASCGRRNRVRQLERLEHARCKACGRPLVGPGSSSEGVKPAAPTRGPSAPGAPPMGPASLGLGQVVGESLQALWTVGGGALLALAHRLGPQAEALVAPWVAKLQDRRAAWDGGRWRKPLLGGALAILLLAAGAFWWAQPPSVEASLARAQAAQLQGDKAAQEAALEAGLKAHPGESSLAEALGRLRLDAGDAEGALAPLREALMMKPDDLGLGTLLGDALRSSGRADEAELRYRDVLSRSPGQPEARFGLALVLAARGRWAEAIPELKGALATRPDPTIWHNLGQVLAREGRMREALAAEEQALKLAPSRRELRLAAVGLALGLGEKGKALEHLQALGGEAPADANEAVAIAEAWGRVGRKAEAKEAWRKALAMPGLGTEAKARAEAALKAP